MNKLTTPLQRRQKARAIRSLTNFEDREHCTFVRACEKHSVSRAYGYILLKALEDWEETATFADQAAEIIQNEPAKLDNGYVTSHVWSLVSGKMIMACVNGEIDSSIFADAEIAKEDPLLS